MRTMIAIALLFSAQAFACPTLTGNYSCTYSDGSSETIAVTQSTDSKGLVTYVYNNSQIPANNAATAMPDSDNLKSATFRAWCEDDVTLKSEIVGKYWTDGKYFGDLTMAIDFSIDGGNLKQVTTGQVVSTTDKFPINDSLLCKLVP